MTDTLRFEIDTEGIATLTLNRPSVRNALNLELMQAFSETMDTLTTHHKKAKVCIITGAGDAFCAGGDLVELHKHSSHDDGLQLAARMGDALTDLTRLAIPVIAAIEGPAIGGGAEIALSCDLRVASENASIGFPQINLALIPIWGGTSRLPRLLGPTQAFYLMATGEVLDAPQAREIGLIDVITSAGDALTEAGRIASLLTTKSADAMRTLKAVLNAHQDMGIAEATAFERNRFADLWASDTHHALAEAFIEGRKRS